MSDPYGELSLVPEAKRLTRERVRCGNPECGKLLAELITAPWKIKCYRCKSENSSA